MSSVAQNIRDFQQRLPPHVTLIAVSKTKPAELILEAYNAGQKIFGENKVQELVPKSEQLPKDISWHLIGHLQSNKVKYIAPFVSMIHSVDGLPLLQEVSKQALKHQRIIDVLLQIHIAKEESKFGLDKEELQAVLHSAELKAATGVRVRGLMGMATNTEDQALIHSEFHQLKKIFDQTKFIFPESIHWKFDTLSMGMSSDYEIAISEGSTMIRVGSALFGSR